MTNSMHRMILAMAFGAAVSLAFLASAAEGPKTFEAGAFTFERPGDWAWVQTRSSMRAAQLAVRDGKSGDEAEVVFYYFGPGNGGGTQANVDRWLGQFQEPKAELKSEVETKKIGAREVTYVRARGTYMSGPPLGQKVAKPGFMLHGAILESPRGNVFVKMTGPAGLTGASADTFKKMVEDALRR